MVPSFNTAGPCVPGEHYMLPPERRLGQVMQLIDERKFFTLHAGHQIGKTTCARWLVKHYNAGDRYSAVWVDLEEAREQPDPDRALRTVLRLIGHALRRDLPMIEWPPASDGTFDANSSVREYLQEATRRAPRPLVVLMDEADGLVGTTMVSFLTQLRAGYIDRSDVPFPHSLALIGRRQVRDYVLDAKDRRTLSWLGTSSPFNITAEAPTLGLFSREEVAELLAQHTHQKKQRFEPEAVERIFYLSQGHPWLVNAMADQVVNRDVTDRNIAVTAAHVDAAKETLILARRTHIDSLIARLREDRVRRIIEPMLAGGEAQDMDALHDDFSYVIGLGLVTLRQGEYQIANPIYREVIPRALTFDRQAQIHLQPQTYVTPEGGLDMPKLMAAWQVFWRKDGHIAAGAFRYREAGPHLMLMAFLQRIVNGGGLIEREYGLGRGALDLLVCWKDERHAIEVKLRKGTETQNEALDQVVGYLDRLGLASGWLVMFDLRQKRAWKQKLFTKKHKRRGHVVQVVGC